MKRRRELTVKNMSGHAELLSAGVFGSLPWTRLASCVFFSVSLWNGDGWDGVFDGWLLLPQLSPQASEVSKGLPRFVRATRRSHVESSPQEIHKHLKRSHTSPSYSAVNLQTLSVSHCHESAGQHFPDSMKEKPSTALYLKGFYMWILTICQYRLLVHIHTRIYLASICMYT